MYIWKTVSGRIERETDISCLQEGNSVARRHGWKKVNFFFLLYSLIYLFKKFCKTLMNYLKD